MFPSLLVQPEMTFASYWVAYLILTFGFLLQQYKKILSATLLLFALTLATPTEAMMWRPSGQCGSSCYSMWGQPSYPSLYFGNYNLNPYSFYSDPYSYFSMIQPWYGVPQPLPIQPIRTIQNVDQQK